MVALVGQKNSSSGLSINMKGDLFELCHASGKNPVLHHCFEMQA